MKNGCTALGGLAESVILEVRKLRSELKLQTYIANKAEIK